MREREGESVGISRKLSRPRRSARVTAHENNHPFPALTPDVGGYLKITALALFCAPDKKPPLRAPSRQPPRTPRRKSEKKAARHAVFIGSRFKIAGRHGSTAPINPLFAFFLTHPSPIKAVFRGQQREHWRNCSAHHRVIALPASQHCIFRGGFTIIRAADAAFPAHGG